MDFRVVDGHDLDDAAWSELVRHASCFQTRQWADICVDGSSSPARAVFLCAFDAGRLVAGMPAVITRRLGMQSFYSMPHGTYGGVVWAEGVEVGVKQAFLEFISDYLGGRRFSRVVIVDFDGHLTDWQGHHLDRSPSFTHILPLEDVDSYRPHKKIEYDLRAGRKEKSEIIDIGAGSDVEAFYRLYRLTESRHGRKRPRYAKRFFDAILTHLAGTDMLYWTGLRAGGKLAGSQIHFIHGDSLINWQTVSDYEMRHFHPSQMLMDDAIRRAVSKGLRRVNLGASPPDAAGLIQYKQRWGAHRFRYQILAARSALRALLRR